MRVGIYIGKLQETTSGGAATFQTEILNELIKSKSEHEFYILYDNSERLFNDNENIKFVNMNIKKEKFSLKNLFPPPKKRFFLNEKVLEHKIEFVWCLTPFCHFVEVPFVFTIWDLEHRLQTYFPEVSVSGWDFDSRENFYKNIISKASYVVIGNSEGAKQVQQFYNFPIERIKTIPFPTPEFVFNKKADDEILTKNKLEKQKYLFYPAQFWPHKNHIRILKALSILKQEGFDLKLAFTGSDKGNQTYIKQKVKEYNLEKDVEFLGFVSKKELISLYKNAFAMTFASMFGPDNIPPLEAMALNCSVICADNAGMKEQLGNAALFFNPLNENELAEKIKSLYEDENLKSNLLLKGNNLARSLKTSNYVASMIDLINEFAPIRECWSNTEKYTHL